MSSVLIAGSGGAGLACATRLAGVADCLVVERLPVAAGEDWQEPRMKASLQAAIRAGTRVAAGTQAVRWDGRRVLLLGQENRLHPARVLVVATGHRPFTRGELGIGGSRCGGIVPGPVARHLLSHGVKLGREPLILGSGALALEIARDLVDRGCGVHVAAPDEQGGRYVERLGAHYYAGALPVAVHGDPRVERATLRWNDGRQLDLACDALILAYGRIPYRNIDGAVSESPGVVFAQSEREGVGESEQSGKAAAEAALALLKGAPSEFTTPLRIAVPT